MHPFARANLAAAATEAKGLQRHLERGNAEAAVAQIKRILALLETAVDIQRLGADKEKC